MVSIHELTHVLGFSSGAFPRFLAPDGSFLTNHISNYYASSTGVSGSGLSSPMVLAWARQFYNCNSINYIPMENDGGGGTIGSHLERVMFFNEAMTGSVIKDQVVSGFTWNILRDTGWWGIDEKWFEVYTVG